MALFIETQDEHVLYVPGDLNIAFLDANSVAGCIVGQKYIGVSINYIKSTYARISETVDNGTIKK